MGVTNDWRASQLGRAKIRDMAHAMGVTAPLPDTVSMPIGADEVSVIDQAGGFAVFANGGRKAKPYAAAEVRNSQGELVYRHDRDAPMPQVLSTQVVRDMNFMLNKVVEQGTGRRAALDGFQVAGKSGTTNAYRDAWFVGYTANLVGAVWFGNDDHTSTNNMTGGSLPAMAWHDVMAFAHQNLTPKPLPGLEPDKAVASRAGAALAAANAAASVPRMPGSLSRRSFEVIGSLGAFFHAIEPEAAPGATGFRPLGRESRRDDGAAVVAQGARAVGGRIETP
jgi:penicillin-binding protein 1A